MLTKTGWQVRASSQDAARKLLASEKERAASAVKIATRGANLRMAGLTRRMSGWQARTLHPDKKDAKKDRRSDKNGMAGAGVESRRGAQASGEREGARRLRCQGGYFNLLDGFMLHCLHPLEGLIYDCLCCFYVLIFVFTF